MVDLRISWSCTAVYSAVCAIYNLNGIVIRKREKGGKSVNDANEKRQLDHLCKHKKVLILKLVIIIATTLKPPFLWLYHYYFFHMQVILFRILSGNNRKLPPQKLCKEDVYNLGVGYNIVVYLIVLCVYDF